MFIPHFTTEHKIERRLTNMSLGKKLWEVKSQRTGKRFLDCSENGIHVEASFVGQITGHGRLDGIEGKIIGTDDYWEKLTGEVVTGTVNGVLSLKDEFVPFKGFGLGKLVKKSPLGMEKLLVLIWVINPPEAFSWMRNTLILWEAVTDPKTQTSTATAYEWE
jgi:hypothetical protein